MTQTLETSTQNEAQSIPMSQRRHRFTVAEFEKAYYAGAFGEKRVELIEGEVIEMPPMNDGHVNWLAILTRRLVLAFHNVAVVISQVPVLLEDTHSQPEPDFVVVALDRFKQKKVALRDAAIIMEVSDSTLEDDRDVKTKLYARNHAKEFWILNVRTNELEVYRDPEGETYKTKFTLSSGQAVAPFESPEIRLEWWS